MARRFTFQEGTSDKFWEIEVQGTETSVRFGRTGTAGQSQVKDHGSPGAAKAAAEKLIAEKVKKGYVEEGSEVTARPPGLAEGQHVPIFHGLPVRAYVRGEGLPDAASFAWRVAADWDGPEHVKELLEPLLAESEISKVKAIVIGSFSSDYSDKNSQGTIDLIVEKARSLSGLRGLFFGDILQEENEVSWIHHGDVTLLAEKLPQLEELVIRGGSEEMTLRSFSHKRLRRFVIETGGLNRPHLLAVLESDMPALKDLELWLGTSDYGGNATVADLDPLLNGELFPALRHLGLRDAEIADELAMAVAVAPIVARLTSLDLSMGTLSDDGGYALLDGQPMEHLTSINLRHHYLTDPVIAELQNSGLPFDVSDRQEPDKYDGESHRYVAIGE